MKKEAKQYALDSPYAPLFHLMATEHGIILTDSEMDEIINAVHEIDNSKEKFICHG